MSRKRAKASKGRGRMTAPRIAKKKRAPQAEVAIAMDVVAAADTAPELVGPEPVMLPERCETAAARFILETMLAARGAALEVDASRVRRAGAQSLQILLSAARTWAADGQEFRIVRPTQEFVEAVTMLGLNQVELKIEEISR